jgi:molecular chaperone GrpE
VTRAAQRVVQALLPVLDSFDQAFAHRAQTPGEEQVLAGVRGTFHQLLDVLSKEGLQLIPAVGEEFDPEVHEAVAGGGEGDLMVSQELRRGYTLKGRVLRPAMVVVAPRLAEGAGDSEG